MSNETVEKLEKVPFCHSAFTRLSVIFHNFGKRK
jgi:hypothetical protein